MPARREKGTGHLFFYAEKDLLGNKVNTLLTYIRNCDPVSVVGYPAISVPAGSSEAGLPIGLQIVGRIEGHRQAQGVEVAV
jgi:mandelamide amidase